MMVILAIFIIRAYQQQDLTIGLVPSFSSQTLSGEVMSSNPLPDQGILIHFWATWCPPCRTSIPHLTETQVKYKDRGVNIIGVTNEPLEAVEPFVNRMGKKME